MRNGEEAYIDRDTDAGILQNDTWTHVAMTFTSGEMVFYLDGEEVVKWTGDDLTGTGIAPHDGIDLCIGQALPTDDYSADPEDPHAWKEWTGYFKGYLDDLRFYNEVLTGPQIKVMYDYENANTIE
jgi:hypothetical protein